MIETDASDLDDVLLDRKKLFAPILERAGVVAGMTAAQANESLIRVDLITFTFGTWFSDLGIAEHLRTGLEEEMRLDLIERAPNCLYPGVRELLERRQRSGRLQVLVSAGDVTWQHWKYQLLGLGHIFAEEDLHFVPLKGSKAQALERYLAAGRVNYSDDRGYWLGEVLDRHPSVRCFRTRWHETTGHGGPCPGDNVRWRTARTPEDLYQLLEGGA